MSDKPTCGYEKDNGDTCSTAFGLCESCGRCFNHCEHRATERKQAKQAGAKAVQAKARKGKGLDPEELPRLDSHAAAEEWSDTIGRAAASGRIGASAANAALRAVKLWVESREAGEVSERLDALTNALSAWRKTGDPAPVLELVEGGKAS